MHNLELFLPAKATSHPSDFEDDIAHFTRKGYHGESDSLLDFVTADVQVEARSYWHEANIGDHALLAVSTKGVKEQRLRNFQKTTWSCTNEDKAVQVARDYVPQEGFLTFKAMHEAVKSFQVDFEENKTRPQKRIERDSPDNKKIRAELRQLRSPEAKAAEEEEPLLRPLNEEKRRLLCERLRENYIKEREDRRISHAAEIIKNGGVPVKSKKLWPLEAMVSKHRKNKEGKPAPISEDEEKAEEILETFRNRWCTSHDAGQDYNEAIKLLEENEEVCFGYDWQTLDDTLLRGKRKNKKDNYGVTGLY